MNVFLFLIVHWYLSLFSQTFFLHRYATHQMFTMSRFWDRFFYLLTFLTQGTSYLNPGVYVILHRKHHAYSDTEKDPHSPLFFKSPLAMMKNTLFLYLDIVFGKLKLEENLEQGYPEWKMIDGLADHWWVRGVFGLFYIGVYVALKASAWQYVLFLPVHFLMGPIHGAIVNWCGHQYGYTNFENGDHSRNTLIFDFVTLGELMQNNHHHQPKRPNFAVRWFEIDPVYGMVKLFSWLGIVRLKP